MKVWGIEEHILRNIARDLEVELYKVRQVGRALQFTLRPCGEKNEDGVRPWQRRSASPFNTERTVHAVCWHGHYHFMDIAFGSGATRIKTGWADYTPENFADKALETGYRNIGAPVMPVQAREACFCADYGCDEVGVYA